MVRLARLVFLAAVVLATISADQPHIPAVTDFVEDTVRPWISDPVIVRAVQAQNRLTASLDVLEIRTLDQTWRAEVQSDTHPMIDKIMDNPLSLFLRRKQEQSRGTITEIFVTDAKGLNVGQSEITSDYWQGDEEKFVACFSAGAGALFVADAERDESTQILQSQASLTISDAAGQPIGVIVVGINLDAL
jgi:hypothetical protein